MDPHLMIPKLPFILLIIFIIFTVTIADTDKDTEECTESLTGLATCLPYVQGSSRAPTADCCNGLKQVLKTNKKCLCVIVKDGNDPNMGLSINVTLALSMPIVCNAPADVSKCPALLHLDPNSPGAKVFNQFGPASNTTSNSPVGSPVSSPSPNVQAGPIPSSNGEARSGERWMGLKVIFVGLLLGFFHFKIIDI